MTQPPPLNDDLSSASSLLDVELLRLPTTTTTTEVATSTISTLPDEGNEFLRLDEAEQIRLVGDDYAAAYCLEKSGTFAPFVGEWVAVLRGELVGHGKDPRILRKSVAVERNVHPERIAMILLDDPEDLVEQLLSRH